MTTQRGMVRGCCLGLIVLLFAVGGSVFLADRALAAPALGAPPAGPSHGGTELAIAVALGEKMVGQLLEAPHGVVVLSEQDLTVLAVANNPHPSEFRDLQVRVRSGLVVVAATVSAGPFTATAVAHISLSLRPGATGPVITAQIPEVDVGMLGLPGFAGAGFVSEIDAGLSLNRLFAIVPQLTALRRDIECVAVVPGGVAVGVHDPGMPPLASSCG